MTEQLSHLAMTVVNHILTCGLKRLTQRYLLGIVLLPFLKRTGCHVNFQRAAQSDPNFPRCTLGWPTRRACQLWASEPTTWRCPEPATQVLWVNPCTLAGHCLLLLWITSSSLWAPASRTNPSDPYLQGLMPLCSHLPLVKGSVYVNLLSKTIQYSTFFSFFACTSKHVEFPWPGIALTSAAAEVGCSSEAKELLVHQGSPMKQQKNSEKSASFFSLKQKSNDGEKVFKLFISFIKIMLVTV